MFAFAGGGLTNTVGVVDTAGAVVVAGDVVVAVVAFMGWLSSVEASECETDLWACVDMTGSSWVADSVDT
jgi:hypothetical protein